MLVIWIKYSQKFKPRKRKKMIIEKLSDIKNIFSKAVKNYPKIGILTHKNPDGDAAGSMLALAHFLENQNKNHSQHNPSFFHK